MGVGTAAVIAARQFDADMKNAFGQNQRMSPELAQVGSVWGSGLIHVAAYGSIYFFDRETAIASAEGAILGNIIVQSLKYSVGRERPNGKEDVSFPSGHTQAAFAMATSMTTAYGWRKTWPLWIMGVFTGMSRIADDKHWFSDVTAGATIGVLFGRSGFKHHRVVPSVIFDDGRADGLMLSFNL